jgi:Hemerythrin HHE cation binding domain
METLPKVTHEHHELLLVHVDELAAIAGVVGSAPADELETRLAAESRFIASHLVPHMERAEVAIYPELERLLQNRHSMTPMRREHEGLRDRIRELDELRGRPLAFEVRRRLRRVLYMMYATIRIHLAEEEAYLAVLEGNLSPSELEGLARSLDHAGTETP